MVRRTLLAAGLGAVVCAPAASAKQIVPIHEATVFNTITGVIRSVVVHGDQGTITVVAGKSAGLKAHEAWNFDQPTITTSLRRGVLTVTTDCKEHTQVASGVYVDGFNDCLTDLTLTVPSTADLHITNAYGPVSVSGISGQIRLHSDSGAVAVSNVRSGSVDASSSYGKVSGQNLSADAVRLASDNGDVSAINVTTTKLLEHTGYGTVTAQQVNAPTVTLSSDNGDVTVRVLQATSLNAATTYGTLTLAHIEAPIVLAQDGNGAVKVATTNSRTLQVTTGYGPVSLSSVRSTNLLARSDNGDVQVNLASAPENAALSSGYGKANLTVPTGGYAVSATSDYGLATITGITVDPHATRLLSVHSDNGDVSVTGS